MAEEFKKGDIVFHREAGKVKVLEFKQGGVLVENIGTRRQAFVQGIDCKLLPKAAQEPKAEAKAEAAPEADKAVKSAPRTKSRRKKSGGE